MARVRSRSPGALTLAAALATGLLASSLAAACSFAPPDYVEVEPRVARAGEPVPPAPAIGVAGVSRGNGDEPQLSCSDLGVVSLWMPDDAATAATIVVFDVLSSTAAESIVPDRPMRAGPARDGRRYFVFPWIDGADDAQEPLRMRIRATALSATGARGGSTMIEVDDPGR
jgi:hypothetical protein